MCDERMAVLQLAPLDCSNRVQARRPAVAVHIFFPCFSGIDSPSIPRPPPHSPTQVALIPYEVYRATHDFPHSTALLYGLVSLACTAAMVAYLLSKSHGALVGSSVLAAAQAVAWLYVHYALQLPHFEPVCAMFWLLILGSLRVFDFVNRRMGDMSEVMRGR
jgi:hypothetical protein